MILELACAAIVAVYVATRLARADRPRAVALRLALLSVASFLGEDSVIRAYGLYHYAPAWHLFVDQVPLMIVLIWPVVVDSAWVIARRLRRGALGVALAASAIVLADAALIEPIAVHSGLWAWTEPGLFAVPPVGVLGWAFFAFCAVALAELMGPWALLGAALPTHALLLASWWMALRWVSAPISPWVGAAAAWIILAPVAAWVAMARLRERVPRAELLARLPGALFFFVLLMLRGRQAPALAIYAFAFIPPYVFLLHMNRGRMPPFSTPIVG